MKRPLCILMIIMLLTVLFGCAATLKDSGTANERNKYSITITDISKGLPADGLWRQNIALADMNGDGFLDIVAPPPRKAKAAEKRPAVFLWDPIAGKWTEGGFIFPDLKDYDYGGVAVSDLNRDGYLDIVLATHSGRIILLENDKKGGIVESAPLPVNEVFHSRTIALSDINRDGWPDIVALSEAPFTTDYVPKGILIGMNREGKSWDVSILKESDKIFGDSLAVADINGDGKKDIIIAPLTTRKSEKKIFWRGDGTGDFREHAYDFSEDMMPAIVKTGDFNGDGRDELFFELSGIGKQAEMHLKGFRWLDDGIKNITMGPGIKDKPIAFDLGDIDNDGREELVVLYADGIRVYQYSDTGWTERGYYAVSPKRAEGIRDITVGRQKDGSSLVVYSMGSEDSAENRGIKAYLLK